MKTDLLQKLYKNAEKGMKKGSRDRDTGKFKNPASKRFSNNAAKLQG